MTTFYCDVCERVKTHNSPITTGYAELPDDKKACYDCCADIDRKEMDETVAALDRGEKIKATCLYLSKDPAVDMGWFITNWPGTLHYGTTFVTQKPQCAFGRQIKCYYVWFRDHNGREWHGVNKGDNQILRCKPLKKRGK